VPDTLATKREIGLLMKTLPKM